MTEALRLLAREEPHWIDLQEATRLLGVISDETPRTLARWGLLRSRSRADGQLEVRLDDVFRDRWERQDLMAIGGDELTLEELEDLHAARPGTLPWERDQTKPAL